MQKKNLLNDLIDYFEGQNKFASAKAYTGMAASRRDNVFYEYFDTLSALEKKYMASIISQAAVGQAEELQDYLARVMKLMLGLCLHSYGSYFQGSAGLLESEFNEPGNIQSWIQAGDEIDTRKGVSFKKSWYYAASLWHVLEILNSQEVIDTYNYLLQNVKSERFKKTLLS